MFELSWFSNSPPIYPFKCRNCNPQNKSKSRRRRKIHRIGGMSKSSTYTSISCTYVLYTQILMFKYSKLKGLNDGTCAIQYSSFIPTLVQINYPLEAETAFFQNGLSRKRGFTYQNNVCHNRPPVGYHMKVNPSYLGSAATQHFPPGRRSTLLTQKFGPARNCKRAQKLNPVLVQDLLAHITNSPLQIWG